VAASRVTRHSVYIPSISHVYTLCFITILRPHSGSTLFPHTTLFLSLCIASTAIDSVEPMRSCPSVAAFDQGIVTWVATRRPGRWSDGSSRCRKGVAPVAPLSSRTTTTSLVTSDPVFERQPKYATYTV